MAKKPVDTKITKSKGKSKLVNELKKRGAISIEERPAMHRKILIIKNKKGKQYKIIFKSKTSGTWQGSTNDGDMKRFSPDTYWIFIDLTGKSRFFVVPDEIMRKDIKKTHNEYLRNHNGVRPINADSTHHSIAENRISKWANKWDLIGLSK